jgi:mono/diheme cytochrome c family protein
MPISQALSRMRYLLPLLTCAAVFGAAEPAADAVDPQLASKAHAVLQENCFKCHGPDKHKGDLRLDSAEAVKKGGEDGVVVVPGDPDKSLLIKAVGWADKDSRMPPKKKLSDEQIAVLTAWVKAGATWPEAAAPAKTP